MTMHDWPITDRPREKLLTKGGQALTDSELLAILIKTGCRGITALDLAKQLLQRYSTLKNLYQTLHLQTNTTRGLGRAKLATILAAAEFGRRLQLQDEDNREIFNTCAKSKAFLALHLQYRANEVFACLFLDNRLRLLKYEELFQGTINEANVYPREILRRGLLINAAKIILAHNHPSGNTNPSTADIELTRLLKRTLILVDIELIDHIIIGHNEHFSFAEALLLSH